jgi:dTDP-4-amino-4,6-dideoxygalactose transaminase
MSDMRLVKSDITFNEVEAEFKEVFEGGIFTRGKYVEDFRRELSEYTGAKHAFLVTSATTALWSCLKLLDIKKGDEVIVSDFSFPATGNVVEDLGARPIFADVDLHTFNMLPIELEQKITSRTKAVIFVAAFGNPTGIIEIKAICDKYKIPLIEDAACAIGSSENGRRCGSIADITCFSFHPRKLINTGEGGAITTNRDDFSEWLEIKLAHGAKGTKGMALDFVSYGYNFRLSELQAIMGIKQLRKIEDIVNKRNEIRAAYIKELHALGFAAQQIGRNAKYNVQSLVFTVPKSCNRDDLILGLRKCGIESTIGTYSLSNGTYYLEKYCNPQINASTLERNTITLPCFNEINIDRVVDTIKSIMTSIKNEG